MRRSAISSGLFNSTRTAARMRLFEVDELIVAGVSEMFVQPDPLRRVEERLARERPALKVEELLLVAIALEHHVSVFADALDFRQCGRELEEAEIVEASERDDEVEVLIAPRIAILRAIAHQVRPDRFGRVGETVARDIEADDFRVGKQL